MSAQPLQPQSSIQSNNNINDKTAPKNVNVGSTWKNSGNINIDLDNLLVNKPKMGPSPSMNQMVSNPTSPVNQPRPVGQFASMGYNMNQNNQYTGFK